jgi:7,8-dihydroneopterin aldolase/epimerase/oxygenase
VTGRIEIRDLRVTGVHGVLEEERSRPQPFSIDLDVWLDVGGAAASDALGDTADYGALVDAAARSVATSSFQLLEALAGHMARAVLETDGRVERVSATVRKLRPPLPHDLASAGVRVVLDRAR